MGHEIIHRGVVEVAGISFNGNTLIMTWITMAIVILIAFLATRNLKLIPSGCQNVVEIVVTWLHEQMDNNMGVANRWLAPFIVTLFMFIWVSNMLGLIPEMQSPTNDLNTTLGLALTVVALVHILGLYKKGGHYIAHFFQPFIPFVVIHVIEEFAKPITLSFRLFGNILAGEILIHILLQLVPIWMPVPSVVWLMFSIFIGTVQSVIFTMLSIAYLSSSVKTEEAH
ncbi:F0F1 ATP synthase subunit A [Selenomonas sp. TAMA-11512]|uniref:F0F1 ATP synthase subunit A n=1 Tax=Selenomonas sp. TAMA-11512 TaxID=3095337 RepID=UPI003087E21E|nr:F0F1 ATP synthase subunit A [Selenomonas sp. TAMA-11512]